MTALQYIPCWICGKEDPEIWVYTPKSEGYAVGKKCLKMSLAIHQINLVKDIPIPNEGEK